MMRLAALGLFLIVLTSCVSRMSDLPSYGVVPDFTLTDHRGADFHSATELAGKIWVADFIFTSCHGPCPRMSSQMKQVQDSVEANPDVKLVSFTIDPKNDTPEVLSAYAKRYKARDGQWHFLTGPMEALNQICRYSFKLGNVDGTLEHSTRFVLVDRKGRIRGYYATDEPDAVTRLTADIQKLLKEPA
jgi:Uncharacterized protein SCO1/SenC/PrrC, involved in biogenesis of respiratory and photosynthetic systems